MEFAHVGPMGVHPRVCGEACVAGDSSGNLVGPSPRVRGSLRPLRDARALTRSIPACAGKPHRISRRGVGSGVHPRVCGEAPVRWRCRAIAMGPSPRVRGSRIPCHDWADLVGSIPACAGKPGPGVRGFDWQGVHPRVCGEALYTDKGVFVAMGPSPRVRGSRAQRQAAVRRNGSIPACAGKPRARTAPSPSRRVHPRVCGEACFQLGERGTQRGPSPRVRGSREDRLRREVPSGSIPACAGKPPRTGAGVGGGGVHPRVCGEAVGAAS